MEYETHQAEHVATPASDGSGLRCGPPANIVDECVCRLERLTQHVDDFLGRQMAEIDRACGDLAEQAGDRAAVDEMSRELRKQQALWEQSRQQQKERIAEEVDMLTAAWDRIEAERRRSLADDGSRPTAPSDAIASTSATSGAPMPEPQDPNMANPGSSSPNLSAPVDYFDFDSAVTGRSAALQFQQIKREIRQHARRGPS